MSRNRFAFTSSKQPAKILVLSCLLKYLFPQFVSSRCTSPLYYRTVGFRRSLGAFVWLMEEKSDIQDFFVGMELGGMKRGNWEWQKKKRNFLQGDCSCHSGGAMSPGASDCSKVRQELVNYTLRAQCVRFFATPGTVAARLLCPRGFSRREYWSGLPCLPPGDLLDPRTEAASLRLLRW